MKVLNLFKEYRMLKENIRMLFIVLHVARIIDFRSQLTLDEKSMQDLVCGDFIRKEKKK